MNKLKYVRIQREDGSYGDKIPFYVDGATVEINGQSLTTKINEIDSSLQSKVVKQAGKGLSANNYTNEEKQKLNGIEAGATNTEIDSTFSVEGAAADAKATGDKINLEKTILQQTINTQAEHFNTEIAELQSLVGSPLVAITVAEMTDIDKIYVYVGSETGYINGNWYYYNGTSWVSGGIYNAVALATDPTLTQSGQAADAKVVGDLKADISTFALNSKKISSSQINSSGVIASAGTYDVVCFEVKKGKHFDIVTDTNDYLIYAFFTGEPSMGSSCINNRIVVSGSEAKNVYTPNGASWVAIRCSHNGTATISPRSYILNEYVVTYNSIYEMSNDISLDDGDIVYCKGYLTENDGMGAYYKVSSNQAEYTHKAIQPLNNGKYAYALLNLTEYNNFPSSNVNALIDTALTYPRSGKEWKYAGYRQDGVLVTLPTAIDSSYEAGTYYLDCSTLSTLIIENIPFLESKYNGRQINTLLQGGFNIQDFQLKLGNTLNNIRAAYQQALYLAYKRCAYLPNNDFSNIRIGDLCFFSQVGNYGDYRFMDIDHVAVFLGETKIASSLSETGYVNKYQFISIDSWAAEEESEQRNVHTFFYLSDREYFENIVLCASLAIQPNEYIYNTDNIVLNYDDIVHTELHVDSYRAVYNLACKLKPYTPYTVSIKSSYTEDNQTKVNHRFNFNCGGQAIYGDAWRNNAFFKNRSGHTVHFVTDALNDISSAARKSISIFSDKEITISELIIKEGWS